MRILFTVFALTLSVSTSYSQNTENDEDSTSKFTHVASIAGLLSTYNDIAVQKYVQDRNALEYDEKVILVDRFIMDLSALSIQRNGKKIYRKLNKLLQEKSFDSLEIKDAKGVIKKFVYQLIEMQNALNGVKDGDNKDFTDYTGVAFSIWENWTGARDLARNQVNSLNTLLALAFMRPSQVIDKEINDAKPKSEDSKEDSIWIKEDK